MWSILLVHTDKTSQDGGELYDDLEEAATAAFRIADLAGKHAIKESDPQIALVQIYAEDRFVLSITVIKGGLDRPDAEQSGASYQVPPH